jgi:hypothetical protein
MLINRHNYEEFFLLYVDNELSVADRKAVEAFVEQNPDLEEELVMMMQSVLRPDPKVVFSNKEALLKNKPASGLVNHSNYEEYFVMYGDNELSNEEKDLVEQFVYKHPQYQAEFELIQQARLIPDAISYPDKNELYRTERDERVIPFAWWRIAAAAIVLLFLGVAIWYMSNKNTGNEEPPMAETNNKVNKDTQQIVKPAPVNNNNEQMAVKENKVEEEKNEVAVEKKNNIKKKSNIQEFRNVPQESNNDMVKADEQEKPDRVVSQSINTSIIPVDKGNPSKVFASLDKAGTSSVKKAEPKEVIYYIDETTEDNINVAMTSINKKPVRGLLRKVKGLFDKEDANDPEPENKKGIRIAAFEISLK